MRQFQALDPALTGWYRGVDGRGMPVPLEAEAVEAAIAAGDQETGYNLNTKTDISGRGPRVFEFNMKGGDAWFNVVTFGTEDLSEADPALIRYDLFRSALLTVVETFEAQHANVFTNALQRLWARAPNQSTFPVAWIAYVGPRLAPLVTPPPTALVERRADGGVLMAATTEPFDVGNPTHMAAARDIERAGLPLSRTPPWDLEG